jgi:hypothetical protein
MRLNAAAFCATALLAGNAIADEQVVLDTPEPASSAAVEKPTFTVSPRTLLALFLLTVLANFSQSTLPRTVHRRLGHKMEGLKCEEGRLQE